MSVDAATPLMQQYRDIKSRHQDSILFFRMGDFYEMFYEDAEVASRVLGLTLTSRNNGGASAVPLAGVPVKAAPDYLRRLVQHGFRVAVCDQVEDPRSAKGIVRREVVETITPGAAFSEELLDGARNNYLIAVTVAGGKAGLAAADMSTGEFRLLAAPLQDASSLITQLAPREILVAKDAGDITTRLLATSAGVVDRALVTVRDGWEFDVAMAREELERHYHIASLEGFGIFADDGAIVSAAGALLRYLKELQPAGLPHIAAPVVERPGSVVPLDEMTLRNLELIEPMRSGASGGTLVDVLDRTCTPMGARLLRRWIAAPLTDVDNIVGRLDAVDALMQRPIVRSAVRDALKSVRDVERLGSKAAAQRANPRELGALGASLSHLPELRAAIEEVRSAGNLSGIVAAWDSCEDLAAEVSRVLVENPPVTFGDDPVVAAGVDAELDSLRELRDGGRDAIAEIQEAERSATGITSLKVGFNRVFGYYIEVTRSNLSLVPSHYQRRQTLTGAERFITPALKEYEERVLTAAESIEVRERELFERLRQTVGQQIKRLQQVAAAVATLDVFASLAEVAEKEGYTRPEVSDGFSLEIAGGRHPVVERMMPRESFIPNDVTLSEDARVIILTGPNMAGKSTILRQAGLIVLMAQMGGFVPAASAKIGVVDRLFTRVGASDNLVRGQSTFMVEMSETSAILRTATRRSLVLLDEIGRGTSTYDGVSIAWSVTEHIHDKIGCKTVFATHYHELTQLADELASVRNFTVDVREVGDEVLFLHKLRPGGADRSYGIEVGKLAGLPPSVLQRAREILQLLEGEEIARGKKDPVLRRAAAADVDQLALFVAAPDPLLERLSQMDTDQLTPVQALVLLAELRDAARTRQP